MNSNQLAHAIKLDFQRIANQFTPHDWMAWHRDERDEQYDKFKARWTYLGEEPSQCGWNHHGWAMSFALMYHLCDGNVVVRIEVVTGQVHSVEVDAQEGEVQQEWIDAVEQQLR